MQGDLPANLDELIRHFDRESSKHKRLHRACRTAVIGLTSATMIVAGSSIILPAHGRWIQFTILILAAITSGITAYEAMRGARDLWQLEKGVHHRLRDIRLQVDWLLSQNLWDQDNQRRILTQILDVLGDSAQEWRAFQSANAAGQEALRKPPPAAP